MPNSYHSGIPFAFINSLRKRRTKLDAYTATKEQAYNEKCDRIFHVWQLLEKQREFALIQQMKDRDTCEFDYDGHRYEVKEIENEIQQIDRLLAAGYDFDTPKGLNGSLQSKILFVH